MSATTLSPTSVSPTFRPTARPSAYAGSARPARPEPGQLRLTRRGRLVVFLLALGLVLSVALFWGQASVATDRPGTDVPTEVITVGTGDTLWEIASERAATGSDIREVMQQIERLNALESAALDAGQRLRVPLAG